MTADFFGATLTMSSYDLEEKSDHGKEEQVEETCNGKGQASRRQEERQEESPAGEGEGEGEGEKDRQDGQEGRAQEGQAQGQSRGEESCAQAERAETTRPSGGTGSDGGTACDAGRGDTGIDASQHRTAGVLGIHRQ